MKNDYSFLGIFQDPLLTLIALILLGTLPIIIPGGRTEPTPGLKPYEMQVKIEKLGEDITALDKRINDLKSDLQRLIEEINALKEIESGANRKVAEANKKINQLKQEIAAIKLIIQNRKKELERLKRELEEAKERVGEAEVAKELEKRIDKLKEDLAEKETLLKKLEHDLNKTKKAKEQADSKIEEQKKNVEALRRKIDIEKGNVKKLQTEKNRLERILKNGGIGQYTTEAVGDKEQVAFEAFSNKLVLINEKNYNVEVFRRIYGGNIVKAASLTRKDSVPGESPDIIEKKDSDFQTELDKLNPQKDYIFFGVQKDSFEVFLKARQIAWERGFVVGWRPWKEGPIYISPGGEKGEGR